MWVRCIRIKRSYAHRTLIELECELQLLITMYFIHCDLFRYSDKYLGAYKCHVPTVK